ncbi:ferritin [Desulfurivibrio dismutans]|uniref:ferritin n=1 Tax=Desulfurivibrio dismutans TaxID=1398908 RepID=UPI0023DB2FCA|nr:ferritin [Desulfurivibrio alkaliphilus]MDF1614491.1 ferritin [Desulfurivibrio alkaliphilus]
MFSRKIETALNQQVNAELYSSYLYLSMSAYFSEINLAGCAHWMRLQAQEELSHALKIYDCINERGGRAELSGIEAPPQKWESPTAVFKEVLLHEQKVTGLINQLVDLAISEKDHATNNFLQWFVAEQVEEEASANEVLQKMQLAAREGGLFILDQELAKRVLTPAA